MCWFLMSQKVALTFFYRLMQQFYSLMRKETTTICFGSMFTLISSVCEHRTESDRVGGISQPSSISQKQVQLWWKNLLCLWLSCFCVSMKSTGYRAQCSYIPFFLKKKRVVLSMGLLIVFHLNKNEKRALACSLWSPKSNELYTMALCMLLWNLSPMTLMVKIFRHGKPPDSTAFQTISQQAVRPTNTSGVWLC